MLCHHIRECDMPGEDDPPMNPFDLASSSVEKLKEKDKNIMLKNSKQDNKFLANMCENKQSNLPENVGNVVEEINESVPDEKQKGETADGTKKKSKVIRLAMCIVNTNYNVVKHVGSKIFKFRLTRDDESEWDLCWQDGAVPAEQLSKMKPYQKINHFPGMYGLARKDYLGRNLMKMRKALPMAYKFFPKTWMLPAEMLDFSSQINGKRVFILKPEASCQGRGIFLTKRIEDIKSDHHYVAQK